MGILEFFFAMAFLIGTPVVLWYAFKHYKTKHGYIISFFKSLILAVLFFFFTGMAGASLHNGETGNAISWAILIVVGGSFIYMRSKNSSHPAQSSELIIPVPIGTELPESQVSLVEEPNESIEISAIEPPESIAGDSEVYSVASSGMISGKRYEITYVDSNEQKTERVIKPFSIDRYYVNAYCELRGEERTFSFDRIQQIIDVSTGEIIIFPHAKAGDRIYQGKRGGYYVTDSKGRKKYIARIEQF